MKWITREKVKVDRVACPWLIQKFIDPAAEFFFVPVGEVAAWAQALGATPFDIEGCELGHHGEDVLRFVAQEIRPNRSGAPAACGNRSRCRFRALESSSSGRGPPLGC